MWYTLGRFSGVHHPRFHGPSTVGSYGEEATVGRERPCDYRTGAVCTFETFSDLQGESGRRTYAVVDGSGPGGDLAVRQLHFATTVAIVMGFVLALGIALIALLQAATF